MNDLDFQKSDEELDEFTRKTLNQREEVFD